MTRVSERQVRVWQDRITARVRVGGTAPSPLVFLHGAGGLVWDEYLDALASTHTVYAPEHPGTSAGDPDAVAHLDDLWDLVLYYDELFDALGLGDVPIIGHSFGAMMAMEIAATHPHRVSRLVLISAIGLWRDDTPVANWMLAPASSMPSLLFCEPEGPLARAVLGQADPEAQIAMIWAMACTGKFVWPISDKGLKKRLHRVRAPALIVWGRDDRLVPVSYAEVFARGLPQASTAIVDQAGHLVTLEHPTRMVALTEAFLGGASTGVPV